MEGGFLLLPNKNTYASKKVILAIGYAQPFLISELDDFVIPHKKAKPSKERIHLINVDHLIYPGLYVAGNLAGHRIQYADACGSGAAVATDILTEMELRRAHQSAR